MWCYQLLPSFAYQLLKGTCIYLNTLHVLVMNGYSRCAISWSGNFSVFLCHPATFGLYLSKAAVHYSVLQCCAWNILSVFHHNFFVMEGVSKKRKRVLLTVMETIDICNRLECGKNRNKLVKEYGIRSVTYESRKTNC